MRISRAKYDMIRGAILAALGERESITFSELTAAVEERLAGRFEGSIPWYTVSVKLDLEARHIVERVPGSRPQRLRLAQPA